MERWREQFHWRDQCESVSISGSSTFSCDQDASAKKDARDDLLFEEKQTKESVEEKATVNEIRKVESANVGDSSLAKDNTLKGNYLLSWIEDDPTFTKNLHPS